MNKDYTYCINKDENCIYRRGCKRWLENYPKDAVKELYIETRFVNEVDEAKCIPNYDGTECKNVFNFLDRFRLSTGQPFNIGFTNKD